jgi:hypothetical protein
MFSFASDVNFCVGSFAFRDKVKQMQEYSVRLREIAFDVRFRFRDRVLVCAGKDFRDSFAHLGRLSAEKFRKGFVADDMK